MKLSIYSARGSGSYPTFSDFQADVRRIFVQAFGLKTFIDTKNENESGTDISNICH